jgi:dihydroorotate dehydrogenase electron transfer subunit
MSCSQQLPFYADRVWRGAVSIEENYRVADDTYCVRFACPEIAATVMSGQFVMLKFAKSNDPLLGRPFAVWKALPGDDSQPHWIELIYLTVGKMTGRLAEMRPGDRLEVWGPLGKPFSSGGGRGSTDEIDHLLMVAGGVGQTPFYMLAQEALGKRNPPDPAQEITPVSRATLCYGARTETGLSCVEDFRQLGVEVLTATEDGSAGHHGLVTDLIRPAIEAKGLKSRIVCCGPKKMMAATAEIARQIGVPCQVSLEERMACGIGVCFSCVAKIRDASGGWTYRRTCLDGPVFDADDVEF